MPRKRDETPRAQVNFLVPKEVLSDLEKYRQPGEVDSAFYRRIFFEWLEARRGGVDPAVEDQVLTILRRHRLLPPAPPARKK